MPAGLCCTAIEPAYNTDMFETDTVLPPDPVIEAYKKDVDRTLIRENLKLTFEQRLENLERLEEFSNEIRRAVVEANKRERGD
jgi:hypothetical protein